MGAPSPCPRPETLEAFARGRLPSVAARDVEQHLERCAACSAALPKPAANEAPTVALGPNEPSPTTAVPVLEPSVQNPQQSAPAESFSFLGPALEPGEIGRLGDYRVLRLLGRGGMGLVFHAEDLTLARPVALKVMKPDLDAGLEPWERFLREARTMARVKHAHVATVFQAGREGSVVYLAMEFLEGQSLDDWMSKGRQASLSEILRLGREIAGGLAAIHRHGLIHRDIKPANIWLEAPDGHVKILDFGLARPTHGDRHLTTAGMIIGTPAFMSPEQARGESVDFRTDLFSLGCVVYALCTGAEPFHGPTPMAQLIAQAVEEPPPIQRRNPAIPAALAELVMRLLAKRPDSRPASAQEVVETIDQIRESLVDAPASSKGANTTGVLRDSNVQRWPLRWRPSRRQLMAAAVVLLAGVGVTALSRHFLGPSAGGRVYLSDLTIVDSEDWPMRPPLGGPPEEPFDGPPDLPPPGGRPGLRPPPPPGGKRGDPFAVISVDGKRSPHGIGMHASPRGRASVSYELDRPYSTFTTSVSLNDTEPESRTPLVFAVYGDGRLLWKSREVQSQADTQTCTVAIQGVKVLQLAVTTNGDVRGVHGVWLEPALHP